MKKSKMNSLLSNFFRPVNGVILNTNKQIKINSLVQYYYKLNPDDYKILLSKYINFKKNNRNYSEKRKGYHRVYNKKNRIKINERRRIMFKTNVNYKLLCYIRSRIWNALKNNLKIEKTQKLLGCSIQELKQYLEKQFTLGMNWKNYGYGWHMDHIRPCASFDLSHEEQQQKCFNYKNLQPLWVLDNLKKSSKYIQTTAKFK